MTRRQRRRLYWFGIATVVSVVLFVIWEWLRYEANKPIDFKVSRDEWYADHAGA